MADRRYRNGCWQGNPKYHPIPDSPLAHGWQHYGYSSTNGHRIFSLAVGSTTALMRTTTEQERLQLDGDSWMVFVNGQAIASYNGDLAWITNQVKQSLSTPILSN